LKWPFSHILDLCDLDRGWHTVVYHSSTSTYTPNFVQTFVPHGQTDDESTLRGVDLIKRVKLHQHMKETLNLKSSQM